MGRKRIEFLGRSMDRLRDFPVGAMKDIGHALRDIQDGQEPADWRPMKTIGPGVNEVRADSEGLQCRVVYVATFPEAVYVLHAFTKKTRKTPKKDVELATKRFRELCDYRRDK
ncbi:MAG: type II toxin-antitoxin system RelE/ParE family toxin [Rhizobiales bacterium]|nr:type II toxin-antitoxin system RelE/ParE family toxin [Hyphomicrobiales bacterium]